MAQAQEEPTMEEILASIRRIISDDEEKEDAGATETPADVSEGEPAAEAAPEPEAEAEGGEQMSGDEIDSMFDEAPAEPAEEPEAAEAAEAEPAPEVEEEPAADEDVMELTQVVNDDGSVTDLAQSETPPEAEEEDDIELIEPDPEPELVAEPAPAFDIDQPIDEDDKEPLLSKPAANAAASAFLSLSRDIGLDYGEGHTLEDIVRQLLRPMLKQWLDDHLPGIVEEKVNKEIARVARRPRRD
ncbi:MAG: pole-organizing protein PopZ [Parvularculaceae bacterium]